MMPESRKPLRIQLEGWNEFVAQAKKAKDKEMMKRLGQVNKQAGAQILGMLDPPAVGKGRGAKPRPSATVRDIMIMSGTSARGGDHELQWGKEQLWPGGRAPKRPYILAAAERHFPQIEDKWMNAILAALKPPFK